MSISLSLSLSLCLSFVRADLDDIKEKLVINTHGINAEDNYITRVASTPTVCDIHLRGSSCH